MNRMDMPVVVNPLVSIATRMLPGNLQAEQALLGAILANNKAFDMVCEFLQPHHFLDPVHEAIFSVAARRINAGQLADAITLRAEFENSGLLDDAGGTAYLAQLLSAMVGIINARDYGRVVHDGWVRRQMIEACTGIVQRAFAPEDGETAQELVEQLDAQLMGITEGSGEVRPLVSAGDAVSQALALAYAARERENPLAGITTGYDGPDRMTAGLMPGQIYLLGARPAMGKSGIGLGIAARAADAGLSVMFWSGEMSASQMGTRLAAAHAGLDVASVFRGKKWAIPDDAEMPAEFRKLDAAEWNRLVRAERAAARLKLNFDDRPGITVSALRARARRLKRSKARLDLLVIDYIGLMRASPSAERNGEYQRMTELSRDLKALATELKIPLLVMAQLNRANESRENKTPQLSDLRDSGALEQDAYCVMFLHRPYYYLQLAGEPVQGAKEKPEDFAERADRYRHDMELTKDLAILQIAKNRNGPTGPCRMRFDAPTIWFRDDGPHGSDLAWGGTLLEHEQAAEYAARIQGDQ